MALETETLPAQEVDK